MPYRRPILGSLFIVVAGTFVIMPFAVASEYGPPLLRLAVSFLMIAALLPVILLAARWIQRRPPGTLSSVEGRLRWRWLLTCLPIAAAAVSALFAAAWIGGELTGGGQAGGDLAGGDLVSLPAFALSMLVLVAVVPLQAAAEEYLMRGWLLQAVGTWFRRPWVPIVVQALAFAALHGWGTPWGFADLTVFGLVAGYLTVRTGGLEAAIALHVANNLIGTALAAAFGDLGVDETAADMPWQLALIDVPVLCAYAAAILWMARRRRLTTTGSVAATPAPSDPRSVPAVPAGASHAR